VDNYPSIILCDECAEVHDDALGELGDLPEGETAQCEICGMENAAVRRSAG
jgi:hypothetical protein